MSSPTPGPRCPRCSRAIAAWRLPHCIYCGEPIPPEVKEGFEEPEALKWVERPGVPLDAAKQFEMMKVLPSWGPEKRKPRRLLVFAAGFSVVLFGAIFVLLFLMLRRSLPAASPIVLAIGVGFVSYLAWVFYRASRRGA